MMQQSLFYEHSGKAPVLGILMTLVGGSVIGAILGALYGLLIYYIPFIYINAFITFGFGVGLAMLVGALGVVGKIRNVGVITVVALIVALVAYITHWVVWVERMTEIRTVNGAELWEYIVAINTVGPWSIFGWTPSGTSLWAIWGVEAIVIVGLGTVSARGGIDLPFCEDTGQWASEELLGGQFQVIDTNRTMDTPQSVLDVLSPVNDAGNAFTEVTVATAQGSDLRCVTVKSVEVEIKDDKEEKKETPLVKNMLFDRDSFEKLLGLDKLTAA